MSVRIQKKFNEVKITLFEYRIEILLIFIFMMLANIMSKVNHMESQMLSIMLSNNNNDQNNTILSIKENIIGNNTNFSN